MFVPTKENFHLIKLVDNKLKCSCEESTFEGLPCRHELSICIKANFPLGSLSIANRWKKDYFKVEDLPEVEYDGQEEEDEEEEKEEVLMMQGEREEEEEAEEKIEREKEIKREEKEEAEEEEEGKEEEIKRKVVFIRIFLTFQVINPDKVKGRGRPNSTRSKSKFEKRSKSKKSKTPKPSTTTQIPAFQIPRVLKRKGDKNLTRNEGLKKCKLTTRNKA